MAIEPLATETDLLARGIDVSNHNLIEALLAAASSAIREAAGAPIGEVDTTVSLAGGRHEWLDFPLPVTAVTAIEINGVAVDGWKLRSGRLWRGCGWHPGHGNDIDITGTFGLAEIPADIVDLTCSLVAAGIAASETGYDPERGLSSMSIDDYREGYTKGEDEVINPMELPERTRDWLRQRFGGGTYVVGTYA